MKVVVYPADRYACGSFRMTWPAETLAAQGHDVSVVAPEDRELQTLIDHHGNVVGVRNAPDVDVIVFQRITHRHLVGVVRELRKHGIAVVVDIDDDLEAIHPSNPAFTMMHPNNVGKGLALGGAHEHSWRFFAEACKEATLVTVTSPALQERYARHGRGVVIPNFLPAHYYGHEREDNDTIGWPATLHSHPNDPEVVGPALARLVNEGAGFRVVGDPLFIGRAFGLSQDPPGAVVDLLDYPASVARFGIGIAPLANTRFNAAKSWLKPLELSAVGVPWVASPRVEYARLHRLGTGLLADRPKDWYRKLRMLRDSASMRTELSEAGRQVAETLRLESNAWRWLEAWTAAREIQDRTVRKPARQIWV